MPYYFPLKCALPCVPRLMVAGIAFGFLTMTSARAAEVLVFTDQSRPVSAAAGAKVVRLDAASKIEAQLAAGLPANPRDAQAIAQQRLQQGGDKLQQDLAAAYQGVADAWGLGIASLPAVVVDRRYVIYGEPDVAKAARRIEAYRRAQQ